jgi:hypothetical protein
MYNKKHFYKITLPSNEKEKYITKLKMGLYLCAGENYYNSLNYSKLTFDKIHFIFCENHKEIEKQMILDYNPLLNGNLTSKLYYKKKYEIRST